MADATSHSDRPASPELVAPTDATVVDGEKVTFAWSPSRDADRYRLQIAKTARFSELVLDEEVGTETAVTVGNQLPTDGQTFFWRVVAEGEEGRAVSAVDSFIASTEAASEQDLLESSEAGPITGLARAAKREVTRRVFEFEDRFEEEKKQGVAYEGIAAGQIMAIAVSILAVILVAVVVLFGWYGQVSQETQAGASNDANYELLQETRTQQEEALTQYGTTDEEGAYRIPIDRAMDIVATEEYERARSGEGGEESPSPQENE